MQFRDHSLSFLGNSSSWPIISLVHCYSIFLFDHFSNYVDDPSNSLTSWFLELQESVPHSSWAPLVVIAQDPAITNHCRCSRELIWSKQLSDFYPPTFTSLPPKALPNPADPHLQHLLHRQEDSLLLSKLGGPSGTGRRKQKGIYTFS